MVGCSGDPYERDNTQAVAEAISVDPDLSFFYHLGDIIYTISGSDTEGSEPVKPYSLSAWDDQFSVLMRSSPGRSSPSPATMMASTRRRLPL